MSTSMTCLKEGHTLKGKDVLPVIIRIQSTQVAEEGELQLARLSKKYALESYSAEDLDKETRKLSGYDMKVSSL